MLIAVIVAIVAIALGGATWFLAFSPQESTIGLNEVPDAVTSGEPVTLAGVVTPAEAGREVRITLSESEGGPWLPGPEAVTDGRGSFAVQYVIEDPGNMHVRATVLEQDRAQEATSEIRSVIVRAITEVTIQSTQTTIKTTDPLAVTGTVDPPGGEVVLEILNAQQVWEPLAAEVELREDGTFSATVGGLPHSEHEVRAAASQTQTRESAQSEAIYVLVEDYEAAGRKYEELVAGRNEAVAALLKALDKWNAGSGSVQELSALREATRALSAAETAQAKGFRAYDAWPQSVAPLIEALAASSVIEADILDHAAQQQSIEEWDELFQSGAEDRREANSYAPQIRDLLGLPPRKAVP